MLEYYSRKYLQNIVVLHKPFSRLKHTVLQTLLNFSHTKCSTRIIKYIAHNPVCTSELNPPRYEEKLLFKIVNNHRLT
jgi:hypothetical protein